MLRIGLILRMQISEPRVSKSEGLRYARSRLPIITVGHYRALLLGLTSYSKLQLQQPPILLQERYMLAADLRDILTPVEALHLVHQSH